MDEREALRAEVEKAVAERDSIRRAMDERMGTYRQTGDKGALADHTELAKKIREVNGRLKHLGDEVHRVSGCGLVKTKREFIGALMAWSDEMKDLCKNPKTSPAERLFCEKAIKRINVIVADRA